MPYASKKQANLMRAVAHSPSFAKKVGIPQPVGKKFEAHKPEGGEMKESKAMMKKEVAFMEKKGAPKSMIKHEKAEMKAEKKPKKFLAGGIAGPATYTPPPSRTFGENARMAKDLRTQLGATKAQRDMMDKEAYRNAMGGLRTQLSDIRARQNIGRADPALASQLAQRDALRGQLGAAKAMAPSAQRKAAVQNLRGQLAPLRQSISGFTKPGMKTGGEAKGYSSGGGIDGVAKKGKTKPRYI